MHANARRSGWSWIQLSALALAYTCAESAVCLGQDSKQREASAPDCSAVAKEVFAASNLQFGDKLRQDQVLLVTLPDPIATPAGTLFDGMLEALTSELGQMDYARERFYLPWPTNTSDKSPPAAVRCPGIVLFRSLRKAGCTADARGTACQDLVALIVPESSTFGINKAALGAALELLEPRKPTDGRLRVLGPFYSGSAVSLRDQLVAAERWYRMASGSLTVRRQAELLQSRGVFRSFTSSLDDRRKKARTFLNYDAHPDAAPQMALMQESGTLYGQSPSNPDAASDSEPLNQFLRVEYPPNLSELRTAVADLPKEKSDAPIASPWKDFPYQPNSGARAADVLPVYAQKDALVAHDLAIRAAAESLAQRRVSDILVSGVLPQDRVFLAQRLKSRTPDLRVVFDQMDRVLLHSDSMRTLDGSLVVTSYPLLDTEPRRPNHTARALRTTLTRDSAWGLTRGLHWLLESKSESGPAFNTDLTIGVISRGHFWPIEADLDPPKLVVPIPFGLVSLGILLLSVINSLLFLRTPAGTGASQPPLGEPSDPLLEGVSLRPIAQAVRLINASKRKVSRALLTALDARIDRSHAWFARGLEACRDPILQPRHVLAAVSAQLVLCLLLLVLARVWCMVASTENNVPLSWGARWLACTLLAIASVFGIAMLCRRLFTYRRWRNYAVQCQPPSSEQSGCSEASKGHANEPSRGRSILIYVSLGVVATAFAGSTLAGLCSIAQADPSARGFFLARSLDLASGASPLTILLAAGLLSYHFALIRAVSLHVLDGCSDDGGCSHRRPAICPALDRLDPNAPNCETMLFESVLFQGGVRHAAAMLIATATPVVLVLQARPSVLRIHDFTLEDGWLNVAMVLALVLSLWITVASTLQLLRVYRAVGSTLRALAMSEIRDAFATIPGAFRRTPAHVIAYASQDVLERYFTTQLLVQAVARATGGASEALAVQARAAGSGSNVVRISEPPRGTVTSATSGNRDGSVPSSLDDIEAAAANAHKTLKALKPDADAGGPLRTALASYAAHSLVPWIRQFRGLFWLSTSGTVAMLCMSSLYVFSARRLLLTTGVLLTLSVVAVSAWVIVGLERDEVLSKIADTKPGVFQLGGNVAQLLKWGVFPLLLAATSYYPDIGHNLAQLLRLCGLGFGSE